MRAEYLAHHPDELQGPEVADPIVDPIGVFARGKNTLVPQNGQVLRYVALRGAYLLYDILYTDLLVSQGAQNLQPQRMRHGLE